MEEEAPKRASSFKSDMMATIRDDPEKYGVDSHFMTRYLAVYKRSVNFEAYRPTKKPS